MGAIEGHGLGPAQCVHGWARGGGGPTAVKHWPMGLITVGKKRGPLAPHRVPWNSLMRVIRKEG